MILLSTSSLHGYGLHRIFEFAKKSGYDGIDLALTKLQFDLWDEDYVKKISDEFDIPVLSVTAPLIGMNEKKVDKIVNIASTLGAQVLTFSPPLVSDKNTNRFTKYLLKVKRETHLSIAVQNIEPDFWLLIIPKYKSSSLLDIKRVTGDTTLDLSSITANTGMDVLKAQKILGTSIKNIFLSDKRGAKTRLLPGGAGGGISYLPLESFFMKLKTTGYNGFITLKVKPRELGVGTVEKVLQNLEYSKDYYKKHFFDYK